MARGVLQGTQEARRLQSKASSPNQDRPDPSPSDTLMALLPPHPRKDPSPSPVSLKTRSMGMMPLEVPLVPRMYDPVERMLCMLSPMPPADLEMQAHSLSVS